MATDSVQIISAGFNTFGYGGSDLTPEEQIASTVTNSAVCARAQDYIYRMGMDINQPDAYRTGAWWQGITSAINQLPTYPRIVGDISSQSTYQSFDPPLNVAGTLSSIMHQYIPDFSSAQLQNLIQLIKLGQLAADANNCLDFWNEGWQTSITLSSFAIGPSWKDEQTNEIASTMTFFCVTYTNDGWTGLFRDSYQERLEVYAVHYQFAFYLKFYNDNKWVLEDWLGGSIEQRIRHWCSNGG